MLNIELETRINPYSEMLKWMFIPGISVKIKENKIQIFGDIPAEEIRNISKLDVARVSNTSQTEESSFKRVKSDLIAGDILSIIFIDFPKASSPVLAILIVLFNVSDIFFVLPCTFSIYSLKTNDPE